MRARAELLARTTAYSIPARTHPLGLRAGESNFLSPALGSFDALFFFAFSWLSFFFFFIPRILSERERVREKKERVNLIRFFLTLPRNEVLDCVGNGLCGSE